MQRPSRADSRVDQRRERGPRTSASQRFLRRSSFAVLFASLSASVDSDVIQMDDMAPAADRSHVRPGITMYLKLMVLSDGSTVQ